MGRRRELASAPAARRIGENEAAGIGTLLTPKEAKEIKYPKNSGFY
jgi:hypothetical protein